MEGKYWFACTYMHDYSRTPRHCINSLYFQWGKYCQYAFWSFLRKYLIVWWTECPSLQTILQLHTQGPENKRCLALILVVCKEEHLVHRTVTYSQKWPEQNLPHWKYRPLMLHCLGVLLIMVVCACKRILTFHHCSCYTQGLHW